MPAPYWIEPTRADTAPALNGKLARAPAIELATMKPVMATNRNSGTTSPMRPPQSVCAVTASAIPDTAATSVPARSSRSPPSRITRRALIRLAAMIPTMPAANSRP